MKHCFERPGCPPETIDAAPGGDPDFATIQEPITMDGLLFLPASDMRFIAHTSNNKGPKFAAICVSLGIMGIACHLTPATLRILARNMTEAADEIDAGNAELASQAIKKAGGA